MMFFRGALGGITDVVSSLSKLGPYVDTITRVINDPALPAIMQRIDIIDSLEPEGAPTTPAASDHSGIGLKRVVPALDAYIYVRRNPMVPWLVGGGAVLFVLGVGYRLGKRSAVR